MTFYTRRFGNVEVPQDKVIRFADGIPGLECMKSCIFVKVEETFPFYWLQSVEDGDVALPVIDPVIVDPAYSPAVEDGVFEELQIAAEQDLLVVVIAVIPEDIRKMSANMAAPLLINLNKNLGKQVVLNNSDYKVRTPVYEAVCAKMKEELERAGADEKVE